MVMPTVDVHVNLRLKRRWYWPFGKLLSTEGNHIPAFIPNANSFIENGAKALGGIAAFVTSCLHSHALMR
ncbi:MULTISPECIES: hypothetical protein [Variovorax]|uniref:Uncharacterized protein n=1 Tax=Variovorax ginsengisoli TaxID=363844 RepID=A0ABT8S8U7_9BURK|nr:MULTISPECIES: hypothetical protein [Variovorax]MDM0042336.1 hypothetical protein [Variovorax sp. J22R193]MDM0054590.1 hypothetical protein [Variovorax sp. J22G47]MDM0122135.1 hypothetical protein [Variovorax sp. J2L1-78]MDM0131336.1 hypothetical protein [Variovorax sp. J2L1-63]MDM0234897.1 hypothetical protein [Variovorax sp. J2R1-6]